ncbi:MAG: prephenate dehydrogenase [Cumulibacter sp.]
MGTQQSQVVGIIGLGLIGGSLALRLRETGVTVRAHDVSTDTLQMAATHGIETYEDLDAMLRGLPASAVLFIATPLPQAIELMPRIADHTAALTVSDVVSVKGAVLEAARAAGLEDRYVGAHPMAGTAQSGFAAASSDLLTHATWVVTLEEQTDLARWLAVCDLALSVDGRVVPADAEWHDHATAWISHLPHVLAEVLSANVVPRSLAGALGAGSYRDATRVAQTRPELVEAMLVGNRKMLTEVLEGFLDQLEQATLAVRDGDVASFVDWGHRHRVEWDARRAHQTDATHTEVSTSAPDLAGRLVDLGMSGGRVIAYDGATLTFAQ